MVLFERTATLTRNNVGALNNWGAYLLDEGRAREAIGKFQMALRIRPDPMPWLNIGWCYFSLNDYPRALAAMSQAISMQPRSKEMEGLLRHLNDYIAKNPRAPDARKMLAMIAFAQRNYPEAVAQLQLVIDLIPEDVEARIDQAAYLAVSGKDAEAIAVLQVAVTRSPTNALALSNLAALLAKVGRLPEALSSHQAAITADPKNADSRHNYALFLARSGKVIEARQEFETVLSQAPGHLPALRQLAWLLATSVECRDGPRAVALANAFSPDPRKRKAMHFDLMAAALAAAGDFKAAIILAEEGLRRAQDERQFALAVAIRNRLKHYEAGKPFTEQPGQP